MASPNGIFLLASVFGINRVLSANKLKNYLVTSNMKSKIYFKSPLKSFPFILIHEYEISTVEDLTVAINSAN